jgi:alkylation response protein AidB-like acyl-CoA dehydrogenase
MQFDWNPGQRGLIDEVRAIAERDLASRPRAAAFDREAWALCGRHGLTGLTLPSALGGRGASAGTAVGAFEALGRGGADRGLLFALGAHLFGCCMAIARAGSAAQREEWGRRVADGRAVAAVAVTEDAGGSNLAGMGTVARSVDGAYVVSGSKTLVTNGPVADVFLLIAAEDPRRGVMGLTAFLVPRATPGLTVQPLEESFGLRGAPMGRVTLEACALPQAARLGRAGGGFAILQLCMQWERTCILAGFLGAAERDLDAAVAYLRERRGQKGRLLDHQAVSHRFARLRARIESARWLTYRGAAAIDAGTDPTVWPAMVKLTVSETVVEVATAILQTLAGAGWLDVNGAATALRDCMGTLSASGTSDAMLNVIASHLGRVTPS